MVNLEGIPVSEIVKIISQQGGVQKIIVFGSRARKDHKKTSDIDLAISGDALSESKINAIKNDLEEKIKIPLKFDVVHFEALGKKSLKEEILKEGVVIYESKADQTTP